MKNILPLFIIVLSIGCSSSSVKEKINKTGDVAGQVAGEFAEGLGNGAAKAFDTKVEMSKELSAKGIQLGKTVVSSDNSGMDNLLTVYMIFNNDYSGPLTAKVFDSNGLEMGRFTQEVTCKSKEAKYVDFQFDKRTDIDSDSRLTIE
jgi:hypothetical protein